MNWIKRLPGYCIFVACLQCGGAWGAPQTGWYWNPTESGRGFFIESHDGVTFLGIYFYDSDGHAVWQVAGGSNTDSYNYSGPLYSLTQGQTLFGSYAAPVGPDYSGTVSMHFSDDTHGTLTWPGGTTPIERQVFGGTNAAFQPRSGWWWNPSESGSGYSIELQGNELFVVGFMYDDDGRPTWYFSAGPMTSGTMYSGPLLKFSNGQRVGGPYHSPGTPDTVGTLDIAFAAANDATLTLSEATRSAQMSRRKKDVGPRSMHIEPEFELPPLPTPPKTFVGSVSATSRLTLGSGSAELTLTFNDAVLTRRPYPFADEYELTNANVVAQYDLSSAECQAHGSESGAFEDTVRVPAVVLHLQEGLAYSLQIGLAVAEGVRMDITATCGPVTVTESVPLHWMLEA